MNPFLLITPPPRSAPPAKARQVKEEDIDRGLLASNIPERSIEKNFPPLFVINRPPSIRGGTGSELKALKRLYSPSFAM
jgi:hypothetical protein